MSDLGGAARTRTVTKCNPIKLDNQAGFSLSIQMVLIAYFVGDGMNFEKNPAWETLCGSFQFDTKCTIWLCDGSKNSR